MAFLWVETSSTHAVNSHSTEGIPLPEENLQPSENLNHDEGRDEGPIEDDSLYCLQSTFVFFQVERHLFCVPTYRFVNDSHAFTKLFKLPEPNVCGVKGSNREEPIILPDISQRDFHNFLKALYPLTVSIRLKLSHVEWVSVLKLSTLWYFLEYRKMAISSLEDGQGLSPIDKVVYGREFKIRTWIEEGYAKLVSRGETINEEESAIVGFETTCSLFRIRESRSQLERRHDVFGIPFQNNKNLDSDKMATIRKVLKDELDLVGLSESEYRADEDEAPAVAEDSGCQVDKPKGSVINFTEATASSPFSFSSVKITPGPSVATAGSELGEKKLHKKKKK